jgi:hypothetical protein
MISDIAAGKPAGGFFAGISGYPLKILDKPEEYRRDKKRKSRPFYMVGGCSPFRMKKSHCQRPYKALPIKR